jgi:hypothetical protein
VGGLIAELGSCLVSPVDKRKREWCDEVEKALQILSSQYQKFPGALSEDPAFVTALLKATATALATHRKEKRVLLRHFLISVGSRAIPDEEMQHALLRLLDDLSVGHIEVLRFLEADYDLLKGKETLEAFYGRYHYEHKGEPDRITFRWILADLSARMVIHLGDIEDMNEFASSRAGLLLESSKIRPFQITDLGRQLLELLRGQE